MKNGNYNFSNLDSNMLIAAVKKTKENLKAATVPIAPASNDDLVNPDVKVKVNPLKLDSVEKRLNAADKAYIPAIKRPSIVSNAAGQTPKMSEIQQYEEYYRQEQHRLQAIEEAKEQEAFKRTLRHDLFGEPLVDKTKADSLGVFEVEDQGRNPLWTGGAFVKNGSKPRGYTDTASDTGAPIRFWTGTDKDRQRIYTEAISRGVEANQEFHDYLVGAHIDIFNATPEQKEIIDMVGKEVMKKAVNDTLTEEDKARIFENTLEYLYKHTKAAIGDPYPIFIGIARSYDNSGGISPEQKAMFSSSLSEEDKRSIFEFGRQVTSDEKVKEINALRLEYKNQVYMEEMKNYKEDLQKGRAKVGDIQKYYDKALERIYESCSMPIPVKNNKGKVLGTVAIGELIDPLDDSLGARIAMNALEKLGTLYKDMDCEQLVKWAVAQENPDWGKYGIGSNANYQSTRTDIDWQAENNTDLVPPDRLHTGDLLYWKNNQDEIVHTAIYLGNGYMIESAGTVKVTPLREKTYAGGGEYSYLAQVNYLDEETLKANVEKNKNKH